ncbi:hypothetical protein BDI4_210055 [Burkholderia diffusa]|nr:hypothetical protein BDI4_210055 [Burkholderia diffusa]
MFDMTVRGGPAYTTWKQGRLDERRLGPERPVALPRPGRSPFERISSVRYRWLTFVR